jgi:CheY-like chemotaxis protein
MFEGIKVLFLDPELSRPKYLKKICIEKGILEKNIMISSDSSEALRVLARETPDVFICDDQMGEESVLELIKKVKNTQSTQEVLFFLMTDNTSQASLGRYIEEEIDGFILKPFMSKNFRDLVFQRLTKKLNPSAYSQLIEEGKKHSYHGLVDLALASFEKAKGLGEQPSNAYYQSAQINELKGSYTESLNDYQVSIRANPLHFKTLSAMFQLLLKEDRLKEAYTTLKRLIMLYPKNPDRLALGVKMAVQTSQFRDISDYYDYYTHQIKPPQDLTRHMCSGLAVSGKYHLMRDEVDEALVQFERAIQHGAGEKRYLNYIVESLTERGLTQELNRFQNESETKTVSVSGSKSQ